MANALSYDKWNVIDGVSSDDDESKGAARPLLAGGKSHAQHQADEAMYEAFKQRFKEHFKGRVPLRQRKLLARFVAMQHRYAEPSNTFRYADIIGIVTQRHEELMEPSCVSLLCDLQKALLKQAQPEGGAPEDAAARAHAQIAMEACFEGDAGSLSGPPWTVPGGLLSGDQHARGGAAAPARHGALREALSPLLDAKHRSSLSPAAARTRGTPTPRGTPTRTQ